MLPPLRKLWINQEKVVESLDGRLLSPPAEIAR
jgi:hypothetical protein